MQSNFTALTPPRAALVLQGQASDLILCTCTSMSVSHENDLLEDCSKSGPRSWKSDTPLTEKSRCTEPHSRSIREIYTLCVCVSWAVQQMTGGVTKVSIFLLTLMMPTGCFANIQTPKKSSFYKLATNYGNYGKQAFSKY